MNKVVLVGKPNVGKSTIFNKLAGERRSITTDIPGTTRDVLQKEVVLDKKSFLLFDIAGFKKNPENDIEKNSISLSEKTLQEADIAVFVCDIKTGVTEDDQRLARILRKADKKKIILVVNKAESSQLDTGEFYRLGFGEPIFISAKNNINFATLKETLDKSLAKDKIVKIKQPTIKIAIVGRPNVGKSSLLNSLFGMERFLVSNIPGTTRDINSELLEIDGNIIEFLDTAGLRRRGKIGKPILKKGEGIIEKFAIDRMKKALLDADLALLIIDPTEGITAQDMHIAGDIIAAGTGIIIVVNKWDIKTDADENNLSMSKFLSYAQRKFDFLSYAPIVFVSSKTGKNVEKIPEIILELIGNRKRRISTPHLNDFLKTLNQTQTTALKTISQFKYVTQTGIDPPAFTFFTADPKKVHFSLQRFLENKMREKWNFNGTPIKLFFRKK